MSFDKKQREPSPFHLYDKQQSDKLLKCKKIENKNWRLIYWFKQDTDTVQNLQISYEHTFPCTIRAINVMEPPNAALNSKIFVIMLAEHFCCKLLQPICILWLKKVIKFNTFTLTQQKTTKKSSNKPQQAMHQSSCSTQPL
jgi:hypothetical protein